MIPDDRAVGTGGRAFASTPLGTDDLELLLQVQPVFDVQEEAG
jgi:hypothetical protein